jgi:hypothetical protein
MRGTRTGPTKLSIGVVVILACTVFVVAAPSAPAASLKYVSERNGDVGGGAQGGVDAMCPRDRHVLGGGTSSSGAWNETTINDSYPIDGDDVDTTPDDGWRSTIDNKAGDPRGVTSLAICAKGKTPKYRSTDFVSVDLAGVAGCPAGTSPSGGGVSSEGTYVQNSFVTETWPVDSDDSDDRPDSWQGRTDAAGFANIASTVYA